MQLLETAGLDTHEVCHQAVEAELLGWVLDGSKGVIECSRRRRWRLRKALSHLLATGVASGRELAAVLGHFTFAALVRRPVLSSISACYAYIKR
eukprot:10506761-Alexandrium_andersonii.AAC.1